MSWWTLDGELIISIIGKKLERARLKLDDCRGGTEGRRRSLKFMPSLTQGDIFRAATESQTEQPLFTEAGKNSFA